MNKQLCLFDEQYEEEFQPSYVLEKTEPVMPLIAAAFREVFEDLCQRRANDPPFMRMSEGHLAWFLYSHLGSVLQLLVEETDDHSLLEYRRVKQQDIFIACESVVLVFKKLKRRSIDGESFLTRSNYRTRQNIDFWSQVLDGAFPQLPRIVFGYELQAELTKAVCYLGLPYGSNSKLRWHREVDSMEAGQVQIFSPEPVSDDEPGFISRWDDPNKRRTAE